MSPVQHLLEALGGPVPTDWSEARLKRLHLSVLPAARRLAPTDGPRAQTAADIQAYGKDKVITALTGFMAWLLRGLDQQHIRSKELAQQACELLCALSDVLHVALAKQPPSNSSSRGPRPSDTAVIQFLKMPVAESVIHMMASTASNLNRWIFKNATSVPKEVLGAACLCCQQLAISVGDWVDELDELGAAPCPRHPHAQNKPWQHSLKLMGWCLDSRLLCNLAEGVLLVLGQDPNHMIIQDVGGFAQLTNIVVLAMSTATRMQEFLLLITEWHDAGGGDRQQRPLLQLGGQGGSTQSFITTPFLRLSLVLLAIGQHWRLAAALPAGSVINQPQGCPHAVAALRGAVQAQLTPSCASELLERVVPWYLLAATSYSLKDPYRGRLACDKGDLCSQQTEQGLQLVVGACEKLPAPTAALGVQELQLLMECEELYAATDGQDAATRCAALEAAMRAAPYSVLVEFNRHHARTLLTLAERSLEAALAAAAAAPGAAAGGSSSSSSGGTPAGGAAKGDHSQVAATLATCLCNCLDSSLQAQQSAPDSSHYEVKGYPADATWALLDASTAPRLLRLAEALLRIPGGTNLSWRVSRVLPCHLPEMQLLYGSPSTARATLSTVTSMTKWLRGQTVVLEVLIRHPRDRAVAVAAVRGAVPGAVGASLTDWVKPWPAPMQLWWNIFNAASYLSEVAMQSLVRVAAVVDHGQDILFAGASSCTAAAAGRNTRAWLMEKAVLVDHAEKWSPSPHLPAVYTKRVFSQPGLLGSILEQLQQGVGAQQQAAAARQAGKLAKQRGGDVSALTEQLQAMQLGGTSSSSVRRGESSSSSTSAASSAGGVPPVTPGDITVAVNALLVACKAAGALQGVPQLLMQFYDVLSGSGRLTVPLPPMVQIFLDLYRDLECAVGIAAEWAVKLHSLLVRVLPAEQGQVLVGVQGRLVGRSSSSGLTQQAPGSWLTAEETAAVLGALQHVVIPGQLGCSNPRCCCLEGVSEAAMKTQVCSACHGARYCSAACQRAHWGAGHKEVCKAVQAAAKAAS